MKFLVGVSQNILMIQYNVNENDLYFIHSICIYSLFESLHVKEILNNEAQCSIKIPFTYKQKNGNVYF